MVAVKQDLPQFAHERRLADSPSVPQCAARFPKFDRWSELSFRYDGNSEAFLIEISLDMASELLSSLVRGKVNQSEAATGASNLRWQPLLEVLMKSRLRELIQQLGEAIHESVSESEQIAGVVQDIREHGFDVLLMLEATIGLNEVAAKDAENGETDAEEGAPFTQNDLHFLRSLRISVEGEEHGEEHNDEESKPE